MFQQWITHNIFEVKNFFVLKIFHIKIFGQWKYFDTILISKIIYLKILKHQNDLLQ